LIASAVYEELLIRRGIKQFLAQNGIPISRVFGLGGAQSESPPAQQVMAGNCGDQVAAHTLIVTVRNAFRPLST
jgi:hypothetical protein